MSLISMLIRNTLSVIAAVVLTLQLDGAMAQPQSPAPAAQPPAVSAAPAAAGAAPAAGAAAAAAASAPAAPAPGVPVQKNAPAVQGVPGQAAAPPTAPPPPILVLTSLQVPNSPARCNEAIVKQLHAAPTALPAPFEGCTWMQNAGTTAKKSAKKSAKETKKTVEDPQILEGAGDFIVSVRADTYDAAIAYLRTGPHKLYIFLNGFNMSADAEQLATERIGDQIFLHYHLDPGPQSRAMWAALIRNVGLYQPVELMVSFGWDAANPNNLLASNFIGSSSVAVTNETKCKMALLLVGAILAFSLWFAGRTTLLRNAVPGAFLSLLPAALSLRQSLQRPGLGTQDIALLLQNAAPGYTGPTSIGDALARQAVDNALRNPEALPTPPPATLVVHLALMSNNDLVSALTRRMSFSLARVQMFCWFMFALLAGIFLWLIYTELPSLDNSMLALLGISAGTSGLAWTIDKSTDTTGTLTQGLMFDLVTAPDNQYKVHRFQTVLVNGALLVIGIGHIVRGIAYPVFDPSWLIFLGISGTTYIAGKQLNETKGT